jgi:hypothetical protein
MFDMQGKKSRIQDLAEESSQVEDIWRALIDMKVTHILMHEKTFYRWVENSFSNEARTMIRQFEKTYLDLINAGNGYSLYALKKENQIMSKYNRSSDHFDLE